MLHVKWLALHHCLWEWSSGEALGSLGQPLWFVLMFWFHNPNILRAVICSLFPFYSVILLLFFSWAELSTEEKKQLYMGHRNWIEKKVEERQRETEVTYPGSDFRLTNFIHYEVRLRMPSYITSYKCIMGTQQRSKNVWRERDILWKHENDLAARCTSVQMVWNLWRQLARQHLPCGLHCNSSLPLALVGINEMAYLSESKLLSEVPTGSLIPWQTILHLTCFYSLWESAPALFQSDLEQQICNTILVSSNGIAHTILLNVW